MMFCKVQTFFFLVSIHMWLQQAEENVCAICLEGLSQELAKKWPNCRHSFHPDCILEWTKEKYTCPTCRVDDESHPIYISKFTEGLILYQGALYAGTQEGYGFALNVSFVNLVQ